MPWYLWVVAVMVVGGLVVAIIDDKRGSENFVGTFATIICTLSAFLVGTWLCPASPHNDNTGKIYLAVLAGGFGFAFVLKLCAYIRSGALLRDDDYYAPSEGRARLPRDDDSLNLPPR